ncbi:MAG TPA: hypothetical protein VGB18_02710, partial [Candidatus Thermoplasmatota archaeon]
MKAHERDGTEDRIIAFPNLATAREKFGENYRGFVFRLRPEHLDKIRDGGVVAFDIAEREYAGFMVLEEQRAATLSPSTRRRD